MRYSSSVKVIVAFCLVASIGAILFYSFHGDDGPRANRGALPVGVREGMGEPPSRSRKAEAVVVPNHAGEGGVGRFNYKLGDARQFWARSPEEIFEIYASGMRSSSPEDKFFAREVASICLPVIKNEQYASIRVDDPDDQRRMEEARLRLRKSCGGFYAVNPLSVMGGVASLSEDISRAGSPVNPEGLELPRNPAPEDEGRVRVELLKSLEKYGVDALIWLAPSLSGWIEYQSKVPNSKIGEAFADVSHISESMVVAMCRLGYPCGQDSLIYISHCAGGGRCGVSLDGYIVRKLSPRDLEVVNAQADTIVSIFKDGAYGKFGLKPPG